MPKIKVKCESYFWGFCKEEKADKENNPGYCKKEKCGKFKIK